MEKVAGHTRIKAQIQVTHTCTPGEINLEHWQEVWEAESVRVPTKEATFCRERILLLSIQKLSDKAAMVRPAGMH